MAWVLERVEDSSLALLNLDLAVMTWSLASVAMSKTTFLSCSLVAWSSGDGTPCRYRKHASSDSLYLMRESVGNIKVCFFWAKYLRPRRKAPMAVAWPRWALMSVKLFLKSVESGSSSSCRPRSEKPVSWGDKRTDCIK